MSLQNDRNLSIFMLEDLQPEEEVNCSEICLLIEGVINCRLNDRDRA